MIFDQLSNNLIYGSNKSAVKFELQNRALFKGLDVALKSMKLGERAVIDCDKSYFDDEKDIRIEIEIVNIGKNF